PDRLDLASRRAVDRRAPAIHAIRRARADGSRTRADRREGVTASDGRRRRRAGIRRPTTSELPIDVRAPADGRSSLKRTHVTDSAEGFRRVTTADADGRITRAGHLG